MRVKYEDQIWCFLPSSSLFCFMHMGLAESSEDVADFDKDSRMMSGQHC